MVARRTLPTTIDLAAFDEPLAHALRDALGADQPVHITDAGRPLAQITPLHPVEPPGTSPSPAEPTPISQLVDSPDEDAWEDSAGHHVTREPYVFDPLENERVLERRNRLRAEFAKLALPPFSAVDWVRDARRDD